APPAAAGRRRRAEPDHRPDCRLTQFRVRTRTAARGVTPGGGFRNPNPDARNSEPERVMSTPITPQMVKQVRDRTDMAMGECQKALEVSGGDIEKAIAHLQEQNSKMRAKREGNETAEGRIGVFIDN